MQKSEFDLLRAWLEGYRDLVAEWGASGRPENEIPLLNCSVEMFLKRLEGMDDTRKDAISRQEVINEDSFTELIDPSNSMLKYIQDNQECKLMSNLLTEIGACVLVAERSYGISILDYDLSEVESVFWEPKVVKAVAIKMANFVAQNGLKEQIGVQQVLEASKAAFLQVFENDGEKVRAEER